MDPNSYQGSGEMRVISSVAYIRLVFLAVDAHSCASTQPVIDMAKLWASPDQTKANSGHDPVSQSQPVDRILPGLDGACKKQFT